MIRHLITIQDKFGRLWLGPENVDPEKDLKAQGCWRCSFRDPRWLAWQTNGAHHTRKEALAKKVKGR